MFDKMQTELLYQNVDPWPFGAIWSAGIYRNSNLFGYGKGRVLETYSFSYTLHGRCTYQYPDGSKQYFGPGDLFFVFPGIAHSYGVTPGHDWVELYLTFTGPAFDAWQAAGILDTKRFFHHAEPVEYWFERLRAMILETARACRSESLARLCALQILLAELMAGGASASTDENSDRWLARAKQELISVGRADLLDLREIADQLDESYANFRKKFTALAGIPPAKFHSQFLMQRACQLLHGQRITNHELADQLGFCSEFHFSRRFLQIVGVTPKMYRERLHKRPG